MRVTVVLAQADGAQRVELEVVPGTTLKAVVNQSGFPVTANQAMGVFGRVRDPESTAAEGDRIEIYRELLIDPKSARRQRARQHR